MEKYKILGNPRRTSGFTALHGMIPCILTPFSDVRAQEGVKTDALMCTGLCKHWLSFCTFFYCEF